MDFSYINPACSPHLLIDCHSEFVDTVQSAKTLHQAETAHGPSALPVIEGELADRSFDRLAHQTVDSVH